MQVKVVAWHENSLKLTATEFCLECRDIYSGPGGEGGIFVQIEKQGGFEGGLHEIRKRKGGKEEKRKDW